MSQKQKLKFEYDNGEKESEKNVMLGQGEQLFVKYMPYFKSCPRIVRLMDTKVMARNEITKYSYEENYFFSKHRCYMLNLQLFNHILNLRF